MASSFHFQRLQRLNVFDGIIQANNDLINPLKAALRRQKFAR